MQLSSQFTVDVTSSRSTVHHQPSTTLHHELLWNLSVDLCLNNNHHRPLGKTPSLVIRGQDHTDSAQKIAEDLKPQDISSVLSVKYFGKSMGRQRKRSLSLWLVNFDVSFKIDELIAVKAINCTTLSTLLLNRFCSANKRRVGHAAPNWNLQYRCV